MIALSDAAWRRLAHYCKRAADGPSEYVDRQNTMPLGDGMRVRYTNARLRGIVWSDEEVRNALLDTDVGQLAAELEQRGCHRGLDLLDLASAMSLEAERRTRSTPEPPPPPRWTPPPPFPRDEPAGGLSGARFGFLTLPLLSLRGGWRGARQRRSRRERGRGRTVVLLRRRWVRVRGAPAGAGALRISGRGRYPRDELELAGLSRSGRRTGGS